MTVVDRPHFSNGFQQGKMSVLFVPNSGRIIVGVVVGLGALAVSHEAAMTQRAASRRDSNKEQISIALLLSMPKFELIAP